MAEPNPNPNPNPNPAPAPDPNPNPAPEPNPNPDPNPDPPAKSFTQEDIDAAVKKAKEETRAEMEKQAKLEKLPEDEQAKEKFKQDREQLDKERAELDRRILEADAKDMLKEKKIDPSFAQFFIGKDAAETKKNIEEFAEKYSTSVNNTVDEKLKGGNPPKVPGKNDPEDPFLNGLGL